MTRGSSMEWDRELIKHTAREGFDPEQIVKDFMVFMEGFT